MKTNNIISAIVVLITILCVKYSFSQNINQSDYNNKTYNQYIRNGVFSNNYNYHPPTDSLVKIKLAEWQKLKFGLLMHWGIYAQWNIVESWTLCSDPECPWCKRTGPYSEDYDAYKTAYENLRHTFYPNLFNPNDWSTAALNAGMKYLIFTTKHLDGFCMFDTKTTRYSVTDTSCPFHDDPRANITNVVFNSFRDKGFYIGVYYSKADWHNNDYWWKAYATPGIKVNYPPLTYPDKWNKYIRFVHKQIAELMTSFGRIDILWLDDPWVNPYSYNQDIKMAEIAALSRRLQPGLIMVDRYVEEYEDYLTPEEIMPENPIDNPWELCLPIGQAWAHLVGDTFSYKSTDSIIHTLSEVAGKGGNLLLNISPDQYGRWANKAYSRLTEIGTWMNINSSAIYETKHTLPFKEKNIFFTVKADSLYAIYLKYDNQTTMPPQISFSSHLPRPNSEIHLLGYPDPLEYTVIANKLTINIPDYLQNNPPCRHAWVFKIINDDPIPKINENYNVLPEKYTLFQNFPNPFNPVTTIKFEIPSHHNKLKKVVQLTIYDILGREVLKLVNENLDPGTYNIKFNAKDYPSGIYFFKLEAGDYTETKKLILVK